VIRSRPLSRPDPRSAAAALLSFLFPGSARRTTGQWALASLLAVPVLLLVILGLLVLALGGRGVLSRLLDARVLIALIVLDVALLGWRLVAIIQAHAAARGSPSRLAELGDRRCLVVATVGMHALPGLLRQQGDRHPRIGRAGGRGPAWTRRGRTRATGALVPAGARSASA
jgi:lysylphosphatidylglycerol synthetase-like protein (DUF2156 family)